MSNENKLSENFCNTETLLSDLKKLLKRHKENNPNLSRNLVRKLLKEALDSEWNEEPISTRCSSSGHLRGISGSPVTTRIKTLKTPLKKELDEDLKYLSEFTVTEKKSTIPRAKREISFANNTMSPGPGAYNIKRCTSGSPTTSLNYGGKRFSFAIPYSPGVAHYKPVHRNIHKR